MIVICVCIILFFYFLFRKPTRRPLVILDMNKLLVFRAFSKTFETEFPEYKPFLSDATLLGEHYTWKRPELDEFINCLLDNYQVAVWSSAWAKNVDLLCSFVFGNRRSELAFEWDQTKCTRVDTEGQKKPLFKKQLQMVWNEFPGRFNRTNTMIIDDSEEKMQDNPPRNVLISKEWTPLMNESESLMCLKEKIKI